MKSETLIDLAEKWEREAADPINLDGSEEAKIPNAVSKGKREGKLQCAATLRALIQLLS